VESVTGAARCSNTIIGYLLPGTSGIQALKILREDPATAHIPVLAISANTMPHDIQKGL